ncbi:hypothetical protein KUIN1_32520 [Pseudomonas sp. KUIN-1]|nr:hypothetical protein KUIN1_32520 [Pseudomonas sp. KUIN-1]
MHDRQFCLAGLGQQAGATDDRVTLIGEVDGNQNVFVWHEGVLRENCSDGSMALSLASGQAHVQVIVFKSVVKSLKSAGGKKYDGLDSPVNHWCDAESAGVVTPLAPAERQDGVAHAGAASGYGHATDTAGVAALVE